jgi:hypothetical protein
MKIILQRRSFIKALKKSYAKGEITSYQYVEFLKAELENITKPTIISS